MPAITLPELSVMQSIAEVTSNLTPAERRRVAAWFLEYAQQDGAEAADVAVVVPAVADEPQDLPAQEQPAEEEPTGPAIGTYTSFADLFDDVAPKSGAQKAVVAGYWLQFHEGQESWKASEVNKLLKSIDVKVSSISIVLSNAVKSSKGMVRELARLGSGERSRKTFCLNEEGVEFVETRIG